MKSKAFIIFLLTAAMLTTGQLAGTSVATAEESDPSTQAGSTTGIAAEVVETETGIYYTVKEGDTLWDLSRKFADSPYIWPGMWSDNSQIANPHQIYPGEQIRLYRREDLMWTQPPPVEPELEPEPEKETAAAILDIDPPPPPVQDIEVPSVDEKVLTFTRIDQVGFIRKPPVKPSGRIFSVRGNHEMIATDDIVYIRRSGKEPFVPGSKYTVYRMPSRVWDKKTGDYLGTQHFLLGFLEIERVDEKDYAIGKIERAFLNIRVGDLLMPFDRRRIEMTRRRPPPEITGEILMAEAGNLIIGDNVIAFINRGRKHGVQVGHVFNLFYQESGRLNPRSNRKVVLGPVEFGEFVVLLTEDATSTVLITKTSRQISPGTRFHAPGM